MGTDTLEAKAHELLDRLDPGQLAVVVDLLEVIVHDDDELTGQDRAAVSASRKYFSQGGEGLSLEQVAATCGLTMEQILRPKGN